MSRQFKRPLSADLAPFEQELIVFCSQLREAKTRWKGDDAHPLPAHGEFIQTHADSIENNELSLLFAKHVLIDLAFTGWDIDVKNGFFLFSKTIHLSGSHDEVKLAVRREHLKERNAQLLEDSVGAFIDSMERRRLTQHGWQSIFSLMRDGQDLAEKLSLSKDTLNTEDRYRQLGGIIKPYLQFVERDVVCEHTGLLLTEIWRYFRHTWVSPYTSLPGRNISILIRDAAAPNHPVIGIAALGSSIVQQGLRDRWIGWDSELILRELDDKPTAANARWLTDILNQQIKGIYKEDLFNECILNNLDIDHPRQAIIEALRKESDRARERHRKFPHAAKMKADSNKKDWESYARTYLYRSKRCGSLADLLQVRLKFNDIGLLEGKGKALRNALSDKAIRQAIGNLIRRVKAEHVGVDMMDIIICGAIPPYTHLLGGKLVCTLLTSPEVTQYYRKRYGGQESIIASSMAGRPIVREPNLVLLGTTSLYGVGSSQYNRIRIPAEIAGGKPGNVIRYEEIGLSEGFGSFHFSRATRDVMETLLRRSKNGRRVNSIFGEGTNPFMRKIREALSLTGLPAEEVIKHERSRVVYGVPLAKNFKEVLIGKNAKAKYYLSQTSPEEGTNKLSEFWIRRWLDGRITRKGILEQVTTHTLDYPINHGARVPLYLLRSEISREGELDFQEY
ncbi:MAG: DUF4338 domain-containing protein [Candidatus Thiodiazotropha endolucinida]|nr:DUF4338 domain-containing protein [Candidatus Thiodiazotropha endolucinida]